jgi:hypothetical protein
MHLMANINTYTRSRYASLEQRLFTNSSSLGRVATLAGLKLLALSRESGRGYAQCTATALAELIDATSPAMTSAIDRLVEQGYFIVTPGEGWTRIFTPVLRTRQPQQPVTNSRYPANGHARARL